MQTKFFVLISALLLVIQVDTLRAGDVDTVAIYSHAMNKPLSVVIVIPDGYQISQKRYPVVYLLHGWSGDYSNWATHTDLGPYADKYNLILVCPDGGYAGWYVDSPLVEDSQYETYISKEVVAYMDTNYRTIAETKGRALTGLSMGGHGAILLLCKHPEEYIAAGSMSGVLDLTFSTKQYGLKELLGDYKKHPENWANNSCMNLVENLRGYERGVLIDDGINDFVIEINRAMHHKLLGMDYPHDYVERPGKHNWDYWTRALDYHLMFLSEWLAPPS